MTDRVNKFCKPLSFVYMTIKLLYVFWIEEYNFISSK